MWLLATLLCAAPRVAVIGVGDGPSAADSVVVVENVLTEAGEVELVSPAVLGIGREPTEFDAKRSARLLQRAKEALFDDRLGDTQKILETLNASLSRTESPPDFEAQVRVWEAAAALALDDETTARELVTAALALSPAFRASRKELPPSLVELIDAVRPPVPKGVHSITPVGHPTNATIELDGRVVTLEDGAFTAHAGKHQLAVTAPGHLPLYRLIDVRDDAEVSTALRVRLGTDNVMGNDTLLVQFRQTLAVDHLVIIDAKPNARLALISNTSRNEHYETKPANDPELAQWIAATTSFEADETALDSAFAWQLFGYLGATSRTQTAFYSENGQEAQMASRGAMLALTFAFQTPALGAFLGGEITYERADYGKSEQNFDDLETGLTISGAKRTDLRGAIGYEFGKRLLFSVQLVTSIAFLDENDDASTTVVVFPTMNRVGLGVGFRLTGNLDPGRLYAGLYAIPLTTGTQASTVTIGDEVQSARESVLYAGGHFPIIDTGAGPVFLGARLEWSLSFYNFSGAGTSQITPAPFEAEYTDSVLDLVATVGFYF